MATTVGPSAASVSGAEPGSPPARRRLASLDIFRGFTIASMVMVNNQHGPEAYAQLRHADWHGLTFTDLVFPFFLWIAGVATTLSTAKRIERGEGRGDLFRHAFVRACWIFGIGLALNFLSAPTLVNLRIPGVLQRIAVCYLIGTLIYLATGVRGRLLCLAGLLVAYTAMMQPGGYELGDNFALDVDSALLSGHLYRNADWDPEGVVSTLPSIGTFLLGILLGDLLRARKTEAWKAAWMLGAGAALLTGGWAAAAFQPINKALWTVPYTLLTAGLAYLLFGLSYWLADVRHLDGVWSLPLKIFGLNALAVYVFHYVLEVAANWGGEASVNAAIHSVFDPAMRPVDATLAYSLVHVAASFVFAWVLWKRGWIWKV